MPFLKFGLFMSVLSVLEQSSPLPPQNKVLGGTSPVPPPGGGARRNFGKTLFCPQTLFFVWGTGIVVQKRFIILFLPVLSPSQNFILGRDWGGQEKNEFWGLGRGECLRSTRQAFPKLLDLKI